MNAEPVPIPSPERRYSFLLRTTLVFFTIGVVLCSGVLFWYLTSHRKHQAALDGMVARIRAAGEPLTGAELNAYYAVPEGEADLTAEYVAAIRLFDPRPLSTAEQTLPIVGSGGVPPAVGEAWPAQSVAEDFVASVAPQLDALRALADRRGKVRYPVLMDDGLATLLPDVQRIRDAARRLLLEFHVRMHRGDRAGALASLRAMFRLSETLSEEPLLISQLVRIAVLGMSVHAGQQFLGGGRASDEDLQSLRDVVEGVDLPRSLRRAVRGERSFTYQALQSDETSARDLSGGPDAGLSNFSLKTLARMRPGDAALLLQMQSEVIEAADLPLPEAIRRIERVSGDVKQLATEQQQAMPWNRNVLPQLLLPSFDAVGKAFGRAAAQREAFLTAIAVERYRLKHGALPAKLDDLAPEFLPALPTDPFTGGPLRMVSDADGYTIYSLGPDRVDQGGVIEAANAAAPDLGVRIDANRAWGTQP